MKENHIVIHKAKIKLYTGSKKSAYDLKDNVSDFIKNVIFQLIDDYLIQYQKEKSLSEKVTILNHLKLNFTISEQNYKSQSSMLFIEQLVQKQLDTFFNSSTPGSHSTASKTLTQPLVVSDTFSSQGEVWSIEDDFARSNKITFSEKEILQYSFLFFLEKGALPWYCNETIRKQLFTDDVILSLFSKRRFVESFREICRDKVVKQRLVSQLNDEMILRILNRLFYHHTVRKDSTNVNGFLIFKQVFFSTVSRKDKREILKNLLELLYLPNSEEIIQQMLKATMSIVLGRDMNQRTSEKLVIFFKAKDFYQKLGELSTVDFFNNEQSSSNQESISEKIENQIITNISEVNVNPVDTIPDQTKIPVDDDTLQEIINSMYHDSEGKLNSIAALDSEEILNQMKEILNQPVGHLNQTSIANSGLIIIHPFLKTFFGRLGLLSETGQLKDPELCVHLLHYLATGVEEDYEHQLCFEKLLCAIPQELPVERFVPLTEEMKQEADGLLKAVLNNWTILRNSGAELLQYEFLQREGMVQMDEKNIYISFERKTQDILIDKLEWTLSFVKLPWLDKVIRVNW